ncbi:MAG: tetratricopeptide repeat protein [bacterium]
MSRSTSNLDRLVPVVAAVYLASFWLAAGAPSWWGIGQLSYLTAEIGLSLLLAALALPAFLLLLAPGRGFRRGMLSLLTYLIAPLVLLGSFYLLRVGAHFLGDGLLRARDLESGTWLLPTEPLAGLVNLLSFKLTSSWFGWTAIQAMEAVSLISGLLFYATILALAKYLFAGPRDRLFAILFLFASGTTLLFCGYVETYSLLPAAITLFLLWCLKSVGGSKSALWPALFFPLLALLHFGNLYLLPVLLLVAFFKWRDGEKRPALVALGGGIVAVALAVVLPRYSEVIMLSPVDLLMPLLPNGDGYCLLSGQHLLDLLNELLLTAGPALLLLPWTVSAILRLRLWRNRQVALGLVALAGALPFLLLLDPKLGYATDWDLFSLAGLIVMIASLLVIRNAGLRLSLSARVALVGAGLFAFGGYAAVNLDYEKSIRRQVDILSLYGARAGYGFESMASHFIRVGENEHAEQMWRKAAELLPHRRTYNNLGQLLMALGRLDEARFYFRKGLELDSTYSFLYLSMGVSYCYEENFPEAEKYLRRAVELDTTIASSYFNLARCLAGMQRFAEAEQNARHAVELEPGNGENATALGLILIQMGRFGEAENFLQQARRLMPENADACTNLAELYAQTGQFSRAKQVLGEYLQEYPSSGARQRIMQLLRRLQDVAPD